MIVGAASIETHDVGDYEVAVASPAKIIKKLDSDKIRRKNKGAEWHLRIISITSR